MKLFTNISNFIKDKLIAFCFELDNVKYWAPKMFGTTKLNFFGRVWNASWSVVQAFLDAVIFVFFGV